MVALPQVCLKGDKVTHLRIHEIGSQTFNSCTSSACTSLSMELKMCSQNYCHWTFAFPVRTSECDGPEEMISKHPLFPKNILWS